LSLASLPLLKDGRQDEGSSALQQGPAEGEIILGRLPYDAFSRRILLDLDQGVLLSLASKLPLSPGTHAL
jgi:hypothetical protein